MANHTNTGFKYVHRGACSANAIALTRHPRFTITAANPWLRRYSRHDIFSSTYTFRRYIDGRGGISFTNTSIFPSPNLEPGLPLRYPFVVDDLWNTSPGRIRSGQWARNRSLPTLRPLLSSIGVMVFRQVRGGTVDSRMIRLPVRR